MDKTYKRIGITTLLLILIFFTLQTGVSSQADNQEEINELLLLINDLEEQIVALKGGNFVFTKDLKLGDKGQDVKELQKILNSDPQTQIAQTGQGSTGQETDFFGSLTSNAVIRFQNKYSTEVLHPIGLFFGTGFVGQKTRVKLNALLKIKEEPSSTQSPSTEPSGEKDETSNSNSSLPVDFDFGNDIFSQSDAFIATSISRNSGIPGTEVKISGLGFKPEGNTLNFGNQFSIPNLKSSNGSITFNVPFDIPFGMYDLTVSNSKGKSDSAVFFIITHPSAMAPTISGITPSTGLYATEITIHGTNFTPTGNQLRTSYGVINDIPSLDGKTLKLKVEPFPETPMIEQVFDKQPKTLWEIHFFIANENGFGLESKIFTLKI